MNRVFPKFAPVFGLRTNVLRARAQMLPGQVSTILAMTPNESGRELTSPAPSHALARARRKTRTTTCAKGRKPKSRVTQLSVLVVDDVPDVTEMIELFLKHAGYEVTTADSASRALEMANQIGFDLVISDIGMPTMNGYDLAEALRSLPNYRDIPLIAVTGYTEYDDRGRALRAGFNAHLTKPIDPSQLLNLMKQLLG